VVDPRAHVPPEMEEIVQVIGARMAEYLNKPLAGAQD
jgi:hypothetical protein